MQHTAELSRSTPGRWTAGSASLDLRTGRGGTDAETVKWVVPAPALYTAMDSQHSLCLPLNVPTVLIVDGATGPKVSGGSSQLLEIWRTRSNRCSHRHRGLTFYVQLPPDFKVMEAAARMQVRGISYATQSEWPFLQPKFPGAFVNTSPALKDGITPLAIFELARVTEPW
jgi:hypothetical protein